MPVPLVAVAGAAPAAVRGVKSGATAALGAVGIHLGGATVASGAKKRVVDNERGRINAMTTAAQLQAVITTRGNTAWGYAWTMESRALAQTRLDQMLAANRAAAGGGAPAALFNAGASAATAGDSYTVADSNQAAPSTLTNTASTNWPLILGGLGLVGALFYFFVWKRRK